MTMKTSICTSLARMPYSQQRSSMRLSDFQFELPQDLIAQQPLPQRDASRMLILDREKQSWEDSAFRWRCLTCSGAMN